MVERDIGDDTDSRFHHVGCIQAPAHADLEHRDVHLPAREVLECNCREHLEKTGMPGQLALADQALRGAVNQIVDQGKIVVADLLPVDLYALIDPYQMGRGIKPGTQPGSLQDRSQGGCGRSLAVRPRNQHAGKMPLGIIQRGQQDPHVRQIELVRGRLGQFMAQCEHARDGSFVGRHQSSVFGRQLKLGYQLQLWRFEFMPSNRRTEGLNRGSRQLDGATDNRELKTGH